MREKKRERRVASEQGQCLRCACCRFLLSSVRVCAYAGVHIGWARVAVVCVTKPVLVGVLTTGAAPLSALLLFFLHFFFSKEESRILFSFSILLS